MWIFCSDANFNGECRTFGPGDYASLPPDSTTAFRPAAASRTSTRTTRIRPGSARRGIAPPGPARTVAGLRRATPADFCRPRGPFLLPAAPQTAIMVAIDVIAAPTGRRGVKAATVTYCVGVRLDEGMIFASDSRTNAGVDNFAKFCKMTVFERKGDRVIVLLSSGQSRRHAGDHQPADAARRRSRRPASLWGAHTMFDAAIVVSDAMRDVERRDGPSLEAAKCSFNASFILGGQIRGEAPRLFRIYAEGNFIEAGVDTPYIQTGETKYGKPIIDRVITGSTKLAGRREVRSRVVRLDDAQQHLGRHADRPHLLRARQPRDPDAPPIRRGRSLLHVAAPKLERRHAQRVQRAARARW